MRREKERRAATDNATVAAAATAAATAAARVASCYAIRQTESVVAHSSCALTASLAV